MTTLIILAIFMPLAGSLAVLGLRPDGLRPGRLVAGACGVAAIAAIVLVAQSTNGPTVADVRGLGLRLDRASALLLAAVTSTGAVVASFARRNIDVDPRAARFFTLFGILVTGSALVVVPGGPLPLVVGWIASSWSLVGLIGHVAGNAETRRAQRRTVGALLVGDAAVAGAVAIAVAAGGIEATRDVGAVLDDLRSSTILGASAADIVAVLLVVAGASRSALVPFHRWLVTTLAAPTPVSALVHAGFVSGAGLLLIRFGPLVLGSAGSVHLAFALAVATVLVAVGAGARRVDVKGKLAWSTVAQMGFMVVQCTVGAFSSAVFHIIGHGMYKASMFLGAGDAISSGLRTTRRAAPAVRASQPARVVSAVAIPTAALAAGLAVVPPDVSDGGVVLIVVFSWLTVAHGVWGWLARGATTSPASGIAIGAAGGLAATFAYLIGLRAVEAFVDPAFATLPEAAGVDVAVVIAVLAGAAVLAVTASAGIAPARLGGAIDAWLHRVAHPGLAGPTTPHRPAAAPSAAPSGASSVPDSPIDDPARRAQIRADVARAQTIIAPSWPLTSFVAANPLGGLEQAGFDRASETARRRLRARTHLSLDQFRADHARGATDADDLRWAIESQLTEICALETVQGGPATEFDVADVIAADLLHGPDIDEPAVTQTALERIEGVAGPIGELIDLTVSHSAAQWVAGSSSARATGFAARWRRDATTVSRLRHHLTGDAVAWLHALGDDPAHVIDAALAAADVADGHRVDELRGQLARLQGWAGFARWRSEWAHAGESRPALATIDLAAARCALEAAYLMSHRPTNGQAGHPDDTHAEAAQVEAAPVEAAHIEARTTSVLAALGHQTDDPDARAAVARVLELVAPHDRHAVWLRAQERHHDRELLTVLERPEPEPDPAPPTAQLAFCIDVRSEGLRRHLEATGPYETLGFAGFFGVPMSVRRLEWTHPEARCPVLVAPSVPAVERPRGELDRPETTDLDQVADLLARSRRAGGVTAVHAQTKYGIGAPFVMAEAAGWLAGPAAAARTLLPTRPTPLRHGPTRMELDRDTETGVAIEQRIDLAEAVLRTMGLTDRFAPLVVLCGHTSDNVNNPHATALDCGACAGASGQDNARAVAALLDEPDVRSGLRGRGIDIPDTTHFLPAVHETVSDRVDLLDLDDIPESHRSDVRRLAADLAVAAELQSAQRARHLPGRPTAVRRRGADWAQVRPEWGLARNAAFVIGPRSITAGLDLDGRAFLHSYDAERDPEGKVLETIMTAPLVVAHWISSQYYFSTVDPEAFGGGDKLVHNVVGDVGVISGEHGDLRVGLPLQSTHLGHDRHHQAIRLLAVVQAPLDQIERIIRQNPILTTLTAGSWIRIAGRAHPDEPWSMRSPEGTWSAEPRLVGDRSVDATPALEYA